jgi:large subunit ribosomal protein L3
MGSDSVTVQNLRIVKIDVENGFILVRGAIPGTRNSVVVVSSAVKKVK